MDFEKLKTLGLSQYEISCYLALVAHHPINGSQLSKNSGIARSRIYDVLRNLIRKGAVIEAENGLYVPLPAEELIRKLKNQFNKGISTFKKEIDTVSQKASYEYIWSVTGKDNVMEKALTMIKEAKTEIYVRLFPKEALILDEKIKSAEKKGVAVRYVAMGEIKTPFKIKVTHPNSETLIHTIGGRSFDLICDRKEALVGIFEKGKEDRSPIIWTRNRWFIIANRDSLRHDFYHTFLEKLYDKKEALTALDQKIYELIKSDN